MRSGRILIIVHQTTSTPGHVGALLTERGYTLDRCCPCHGDSLPAHLDDHDGVVVFGGPMSANDCDTLDGIRAELDFIPKVLSAEKPFLGICLGGQMLARTLGGKVAPDADGRVEIGYTEVTPSDEFTDLFAASQYFYQWHKEGFELPNSARIMAHGAVYPNQAFLYGENAVGIQFHPEITHEMIRRWSMGAAHRLDQPGAQPRIAHEIGYRLFNSGVDRWTRGMLDFLDLPHLQSSESIAAD